MGEKLTCFDCPAPYGEDGWVDVVVPNEIWTKIQPHPTESGYDGGGVLCFRCMTKRILAAGLDPVPVIIASGPYRDANEEWRLNGFWQDESQAQQTIAGLKEEIDVYEEMAERHCRLSEKRLARLKQALADQQHEHEERVAGLAAALQGFMEDAEIQLRGGIVDEGIREALKALCDRHGYGNVICSASMLWREITPVGAFLFGPCVGTAKHDLAQANAALADSAHVLAGVVERAKAEADAATAQMIGRLEPGDVQHLASGRAMSAAIQNFAAKLRAEAGKAEGWRRGTKR